MGAVHADGIVSSDIVGYNTKSITANQFYLLGAQFEGIGEDGVAGLNTSIQTTGISPVLYDNTDDAARIDVLTADASGYISYYYISDADDGTERYNLTGWADGDGFIVDDAVINAGAAFWVRSPTGGSLTFSL